MLGKNPRHRQVSSHWSSRRYRWSYRWSCWLDFSLTVGTFQFVENFTWIETLGISYNVGVDGISIPMVFLTTLLVFLAILFSWDVEERTNQYMGLMLVLEVGVLGVFMSLDYFLFYVFWEVVLIPMYFLIAVWGGPRRAYASIKFFIYTHIASLVMLLGILALYFEASAPCWAHRTSTWRRSPRCRVASVRCSSSWCSGRCSSGSSSRCRWSRSTLGFRTRTSQAPTAGSVLLAGLLLKMGSYGIIRVCLPTFAVWRRPIPDGHGHNRHSLDHVWGDHLPGAEGPEEDGRLLVHQPHGHRHARYRHL